VKGFDWVKEVDFARMWGARHIKNAQR